MEYEITKCHYCGTAMFRLRVLNDCGEDFLQANLMRIGQFIITRNHD